MNVEITNEDDVRSAINRLECGNTAHSRKAPYIRLAIEALELQLPEKPALKRVKNMKSVIAWECPHCHAERYLLMNSHNLGYCQACGKAVNWDGWETEAKALFTEEELRGVDR